MSTHHVSIAAIAAAALFTFGSAVAQTGTNNGETGGGASTKTGAGIVTSGSAVPAGQQPRATDTTLGKQPGGTKAGMGERPAGKSVADLKQQKSKSTKTATAKAKKKRKTAERAG